MIWTYVGDALWVVALAIMFGVSREAARQVPAGVRPPILGARVSRPLALWALPTGAFLLSLWFAWTARTQSGGGDEAFILFGVRAVTASAAALLHLRWIGGALKTLARESALKP